ncbi:MAG: hypothetical protein F4148_09270 [Caldilineaceae bacterium SB0675_bin_29]|uniref:Uncharacterized protein n=1 Tax=Caldilineaceae bacterium SB0675_bin_29 TaxID=2605266 RepID=A0A6B1FXS7_9CHLR|nr:hypothetical protein [Caldilineaceae bacterium SB0675_bin_29]
MKPTYSGQRHLLREETIYPDNCGTVHHPVKQWMMHRFLLAELRREDSI